MTDAKKQEAYRIARKVLVQAADEEWNYVNLGPFFQGDSEIRKGFEALMHLSTLPDEIRRLREGIFIELRGTQLEDLKPLAHVKGLGRVNFEGTPAEIADTELQTIAAIANVEERTNRFLEWLEANKIEDPPEVIEGGPQFVIDDVGPIKLLDFPLINSDDDDQEELQQECRRKASELSKIVELAANVAPDLQGTVQKYGDLLEKEPASIGARRVWSLANSLEAALEVHRRAITEDRPAEELPSLVAAKLTDLSETHRVWFLGHPGAREVEDRARKHSAHADDHDRRAAVIKLVEAAETSDAVAQDATIPARENIGTSGLNTPAGIAALGELEEWSWNFVASIVRKAWAIAKNPPGGFVSQTLSGHYLILFLINNDEAIRLYAQTVMSQGPLWWDSLCIALRRLAHSQDEDSNDN